MNANNPAPVDVRAALELQRYRLRAGRLTRELRDCMDRELRQVDLAVAELIEADVEFDAARLAGNAARIGEAATRRRAALARMKGA